MARCRRLRHTRRVSRRRRRCRWRRSANARRAPESLRLSLAGSALAGDITGKARPVDGDTLEVADQIIRLDAIDAPERSQTCTGVGGVTYECGRDAAATLAALIRDRVVTCVPQSRDRYGRTVATCSTAAGDIGAAMVRAGWATAYRRYGHQYVADEEAARAGRRGMWSGRFTEPEQWRRERR